METITIDSSTKLHAITVMFIVKKTWLKLDKSRDCVFFSLFVFRAERNVYSACVLNLTFSKSSGKIHF